MGKRSAYFRPEAEWEETMSSVYRTDGPPAPWRTVIKYEALALIVVVLAAAVFLKVGA